MKIKALGTIIDFDGGQMVVINEGETGDLSDAKAEQYIASGKAEAVKTRKAKAVAADPVDETAPVAPDAPVDDATDAADEAPAA